MKAKHAKQQIKKNQEYMEKENEWGDTEYVVEGVAYKTEAEAKKAIHDLITAEFNSRYIPKKEEVQKPKAKRGYQQ